MSEPQVLLRSDALHQQVQRFVNASLQRPPAAHEFERLALEIAAFQAQYCAPVGRLFAAHGTRLAALALLPALPSDVFRLTRVAVHAPAADTRVFRTSGTTAAHSGLHPLHRLDTYRVASVAGGRLALLGRVQRATVVALLPPPADVQHSSLAAMCGFFMDAFDACPLPGEAAAGACSQSARRWLVSSQGIDVQRLREAVVIANQRSEPLLLLSTSLALLALLQQLGTERLPLPPGSVVMQTGGSKGRVHEVDPDALRTQLARALGIEPSRVISEYGMTELGSQMYEGHLWHGRNEPGLYFAPPWLRVTAVDPVSLQPCAAGQVGLARFVDLTNVDSALIVLSHDLIREEDGAIRLLGRQASSPLRGCSLLSEALLEGAAQ